VQIHFFHKKEFNNTKIKSLHILTFKNLEKARKKLLLRFFEMLMGGGIEELLYLVGK